MLNDTCLLIRQIKNCQSQKMSDSPIFNPSKYTHYTVVSLILHKCENDNFNENETVKMKLKGMFHSIFTVKVHFLW